MTKLLATALCIVLAAGTTVLSLRDFVDHARWFPVLVAAKRLSAGGRAEATGSSAARMVRAATDLGASCRPTRDDAVADVALAELLVSDPAGRYEAWAAAAERADGLFRHALACAPTDGVAWVRLALVERLVSLSPARASELLALSYRLAPADPVALASRVLLWRGLPAGPGAADEAVRRADIDTILRQAWPPEAAFLLRNPDARLANAIEDAMATLPARSQQHLRSAGLLARPAEPTVPASSGTIGYGLARFMNRPPSW